MAHLLCSDVQYLYFGTFMYYSCYWWIPLNCPIDFLSCLYWSNCFCGSVALIAICFPFTNSHIKNKVWLMKQAICTKQCLFSSGSTVICCGLYNHLKPHNNNSGFQFYIKLQLRKKTIKINLSSSKTVFLALASILTIQQNHHQKMGPSKLKITESSLSGPCFFSR